MKTMTPPVDRVLRPWQLAMKLGCHRITLYNWVKRGMLPAPIRLSPRVVGWRESDIEAWLARRSQEGGF